MLFCVFVSLLTYNRRVMMAEVLENMEEDGDNGATEGKINGALQPPLMALAASVVSSGASPTPNEEVRSLITLRTRHHH